MEKSRHEKRKMMGMGWLLPWGMALLMTGIGERGFAAGPGPVQAVTPETVIVAMGDSLTEGHGLAETEAWPALLEKRLRAEGYAVRVVNAGVSGETSEGARSRLNWVLNLKPDILILATGANDGLRGLDTSRLSANLDRIIATCRDRGIPVVLAGMKMVRNMGQDYAMAFEAVYPDVAMRHGLILIPFLLEGVAGDPGLNLADGIHPNAEGYRRVAEIVMPYAREALSRLRNGVSKTGPTPPASRSGHP